MAKLRVSCHCVFLRNKSQVSRIIQALENIYGLRCFSLYLGKMTTHCKISQGTSLIIDYKRCLKATKVSPPYANTYVGVSAGKKITFWKILCIYKMNGHYCFKLAITLQSQIVPSPSFSSLKTIRLSKSSWKYQTGIEIPSPNPYIMVIFQR